MDIEDMEPLRLDVSDLLAKSLELERVNEDLKVKYDDLQKEAERYKTQLREEKRSKVSVEERRKGVEEELNRISKKYESASEGKSAEETKEQELEELKSLREEVIDLKAQVRAYKLEIADHIEDRRKLEDNLEDSERKLHEKGRAAEKAHLTVQELEAKLRENETLLAKNGSEADAVLVIQLEKSVADVKKKLEAKRVKHRNLKGAKAKADLDAKETTRRIAALELQVETLERDAGIAQDKADEANKKLRDNLEVVVTLKQNKKDLETECDKLKAREKENKQKLDESKQQEEKLKNDMRELKLKYGEKEKESRTLTDLKSEIALQLEEMKSEKFENEDLSDEGLLKVLEETRNKYEQEKNKTHDLSAEVDRLNIELEDSRKVTADLENTKTKLKDVKQKKKDLKSESKDIRKELDKAKREREEAEEDKTLLASELDVAKTKLKQVVSQDNNDANQQLKTTTKEYEDKLKKAKDSKKMLEDDIESLNEKLKQKETSETSLKTKLEKEKQSADVKQKEIDELKKKHTEESKAALARKERMEDEIKTLKSKIKDSESEKNKLQDEIKKKQTKEAQATNNGKAAELTDREKALKAQFERLKQLVVESEKKTTEKHDETAVVVENVKDKLELGREQLVALRRATQRLQRQVDARRNRLNNAGVDELGLLELLEEEEDKLSPSEEDLVRQINDRDASSLDRSDALAKSLTSKLDNAKEKNKARVLIEVKELVKDINARLATKLSYKEVDRELGQSAEVVAVCKKLQSRIVHELHSLQIMAQEHADGIRSLRYGWWRRKGKGYSREEELQTAVSFLITESQRLTELRDKYVTSHNTVAEYTATLNKTEKDLAKWKLGLEELQDRVTVGAGWGHAALAARLLACRRILDRHHFHRASLDTNRQRRATLRLAVENFVEGLYVIFNEGLSGLGVRGIGELTRIRDLEGQVLAVREEMDQAHIHWEEAQQQHKGELITSHAGVMIVDTLIAHFDTLFDTYDDEDVPEIIVKSVDYLLDNALKDKSLLLRDYDNPKIKEIRQYFEVGTYDVDLSDCTDHSVISELLKSYLREAHDTLLTNNLHDEWLAVDNIVDDNERLEAISKLLRKLPESNYASLAVIMELLYEVERRHKVNKCSRRLLARTFGPLILRSTTSPTL